MTYYLWWGEEYDVKQGSRDVPQLFIIGCLGNVYEVIHKHLQQATKFINIGCVIIYIFMKIQCWDGGAFHWHQEWFQDVHWQQSQGFAFEHCSKTMSHF